MTTFLFLTPLVYLISLRKELLPALWFLLALVSSIRYGVGSDYFSYVHAFDIIGNGVEHQVFQSKEFLYRKIVETVYVLNGGPEHVFILFSTLTHIFFYYGSKNYFKNECDRFLFVILYFALFYFYTMIGIRQALVTSMIFFAASRTNSRNDLLSISILLTTIWLHYSAVVPVLLLLLTRIQILLSALNTFALSILLLLAYLIDIADIVQQLLKFLGMPYHWYLGLDEFNGKPNTFSVFITVISTFFCLFLRKLVKERGICPVSIDTMLIFFLGVRIFAIEIEIFNRLAIYAKPFIIIFMILALNAVLGRRQSVFSISLFAYFYSILSIIVRGLNDESFAEFATIL